MTRLVLTKNILQCEPLASISINLLLVSNTRCQRLLMLVALCVVFLFSIIGCSIACIGNMAVLCGVSGKLGTVSFFVIQKGYS